MRAFTFPVITALVLYSVHSIASETPKLEQDTDRISYSLGQQIGMDIKRQGLVFDKAALSQGLYDAFNEIDPRLGQQDMEERLSNLKDRISYDMRSKELKRVMERKADMERKRLEAHQFLEENAKRPGVTTLDDGLQYRVITQGKGIKPQVKDKVTIHYRGRKLDGEEFDSSYRRNKPSTVEIMDLIPGIKEAVQLMQPGAKWELYIPPTLGYGRETPMANQAVIVELELLAVDTSLDASKNNNATLLQNQKQD